MAFSFSFFAPPSTGDLYPVTAENEQASEEPKAPVTAPTVIDWTQYEELLGLMEQPTSAAVQEPELPLSQPPAPLTAGLAALAVQQSTAEPLAMAPPSRKLGSLTPGPAIAASLALAAQASGPVHPPPQALTSTPSPSTSTPFNHLHGLQSHELAQLRLDLEREIEQVRQDLFGAAMGVSALKDRIDGLESHVAKSPAQDPGLTSGEIERLVKAWLNAHLPSHLKEPVKKTLDQALQETINTLSSSEFFRLPVRCPGFSPDSLLSQAPQVISSSRS
ncbi:hypothetical protein SAMN02745166_00530 [Prosthecobacter debontii]|uniref:Uncharacterized protein n=1 Tax=Prosthecobacter debontii TaxID=48467 RepID=A0A1T4WSV6_9BACT|nr:hypothetical protein [Prosthecobacter debontii]SKA79691.1 hypothetical protein SAMN02745166_00530 [Prosthecobacter debontii]